MAPQFVKPYVKTNKNDMADAEAICEAVSRPNMRFVAIKTIEQQAILSVHRARQGFVKARTAQGNQIRGLLSSGDSGLALRARNTTFHDQNRRRDNTVCGFPLDSRFNQNIFCL
jgi:transposase